MKKGIEINITWKIKVSMVEDTQTRLLLVLLPSFFSQTTARNTTFFQIIIFPLIKHQSEGKKKHNKIRDGQGERKEFMLWMSNLTFGSASYVSLKKSTS